ncbi:MAG: Holliday junction resolvase RuvX [Betaproteobacteria bacterium]|jgi:putative Holliday junction resolvase|nr:Holliday junction resolvase RuvX [Betaproteobacteria bacterium]
MSLAVVSPMAATELQSFLAFDFGQQRTGVAYASRLMGQARPEGSVHASGQARWPLIAKHIEKWQPEALVVGVPFHPDGAIHENTLQAQKFARQLRARFGLPVFEVDERYSTTEARSQGVKDVDAASACVILDQFLRSLNA